MTDQRACVGGFFKVPGGIRYGQYWLNVKFAKSLVRVPFRILTGGERVLSPIQGPQHRHSVGVRTRR